jgi:hypothetical protein
MNQWTESCNCKDHAVADRQGPTEGSSYFVVLVLELAESLAEDSSYFGLVEQVLA